MCIFKNKFSRYYQLVNYLVDVYFTIKLLLCYCIIEYLVRTIILFSYLQS